MEYELRFYLNRDNLNEIINNLNNNKDLIKKERTYEKTLQYNHNDPKYDFYSKNIDGRFRIRLSKNSIDSQSKISWKKRLNDTILSNVNKEEEKEIHFDYDDYDNLIYIVETILHMNLVESYERYRTIYENKYVEISIDEYPFGTAIEVESKTSFDAEKNVKKWVNNIGLDIKDSYRLSWDDKYQELCTKQGIKYYKEVTFDKEMPKIN